MTELGPAIIRGGALLVPIALTAALWHWREPDRRLAAGVLLGVVWNATALLAVNLVAVRAGWWTFKAEGGLVFGLPLDVLIGWTLCWGAVPLLAMHRHVVAVALPAAALLDIVAMPTLQPVVQLQATWLLGESVALVACLLPGVLLGVWTATGTRLRARATLQVVLAGALLLWLLPAAALEDPAGVVAVIRGLAPWQAGLLLAVLAMCSLPGVAAVNEFVTMGEGTPVPYDPPRRLVSTGPYAYCRTPMQTSVCALTALLAAVSWSPHLGLAVVVAVAYSVGLAQWHEEQELPERFGARWLAYCTAVPTWRPRWRPSPHGPNAVLWAAASCQQCKPVGVFFSRRHPVRLDVRDAESHPGTGLQRITYEVDGRRFTGVVAIARAAEHLNLGWATVGWVARLPLVAGFLQVVVDASGGGPRTLSAGAGSPVGRDVLGLEEFQQPVVATLATQSAVLHAAERSGRVRDEAAVQTDHARLQRLGDG